MSTRLDSSTNYARETQSPFFKEKEVNGTVYRYVNQDNLVYKIISAIGDMMIVYSPNNPQNALYEDRYNPAFEESSIPKHVGSVSSSDNYITDFFMGERKS